MITVDDTPHVPCEQWHTNVEHWQHDDSHERISMLLERSISLSFKSKELPDLCHMIVTGFHTELQGGILYKTLVLGINEMVCALPLRF